MKIQMGSQRSTSSVFSRRMARKENAGIVRGDQLNPEGSQVARKVSGNALLRRGAAKKVRVDSGVGDADELDNALDHLDDLDDENLHGEISHNSQGDTMKTVTVHVPEDYSSVSGDVIFSPVTSSTAYCCKREARNNLRRRMPDYEVTISDVMGEGHVETMLSRNFDFEGTKVHLVAVALASSTDMAVSAVRIEMGERTYNIDPASRARTPEQTADFLARVARNCVSGGYEDTNASSLD